MTNVSKFHHYYHSIKDYVDTKIIPNAGITLLILAQFFNSIMVTTCKLLETDKSSDIKFNPFQILFYRMLITYICCLLYMYITKSVEDSPFGPKSVRHLLFTRGFLGFFGVFGLYFSLQYLSLSDAVAITFLVPMITGIMAWIMLHERYSIIQGICAVISFTGVLLIAKPSFIFGEKVDSDSVDDSVESSSTQLRLLATGVGIIGVFGASGVYITIRKIGDAAHPLLSVSYFAMTCCFISCIGILVVPSYSFVLPTTGYQWFLFVLIGLSGFIMQFCLTAGIQRVHAGKASIMSYSNMIFALIWDVVIWHHFPGILSCLGIIIIISCAVVIVRNKTPTSTLDPESSEGDPKYQQIALQDFEISDDDSEETSRSSSAPQTPQKEVVG